MTVPNVVIGPDTHKRIRIETETAAVKLNEIAVVREKPVIQGEISITMYLIPSRKIASPRIGNLGGVHGGWRPDRRPFRVKSLPAGEHPPFGTAAWSPGRGAQRGGGNQPV